MNLEEIWKAFRWPLLVVLIILAMIFPRPSKAQANCAPREVVLERLATGYGEERQSVGLGGGGAMVETFANRETGSWTIVATLPNGASCLLASGQAFELVNEPLPQGAPL